MSCQRHHLIFHMLVAAMVSHGSGIGRQKVAIVADVGVDDAGALIWALSDNNLEVLGVGSTFGCHPDARVTATNARRVLRAAGRLDIPVFVGSRYPLGATAPLDSGGTLFHGADGFGDLQAGDDDGQTCVGSTCSAANISWGPSTAEFLVQVAREYPGEVIVLCFSPLTDVALATMLEPSLSTLLRSLVVMGGAVFVPGNVSPFAEANFYHDAVAAELVLHVFNGKSLVLAPLDVTMKANLEPAHVNKLAASGSTVSRMWARASEFYSRAYCNLGGLCQSFPLHDAHTVAYATHPAMYTNVTKLYLKVVVTRLGEPTHGASIVDKRGHSDMERRFRDGWNEVLVLLDVDQAQFVETFLDASSRLL